MSFMFYFRWIIVSLLTVGNFFVWYSITQFFNRELIISYLSVGQGDAALIRAPGGRTILIDGGPDRNILSKVSEALPLFYRSIDLLIETHPDTDHVAGLPDVLKTYQVRGILKPCIGSDNPYDQALETLALEKSVTQICALSGQLINLGEGTNMEVLYAGSGKLRFKNKTNDASIVSRLSFGSNSFLFTGDTTIAVEKYLSYHFSAKLKSNVYKVSHHGSRESNDQKFLQLVDPDISIISVGAGNRYGHPHQEVLNSLNNLGSLILRTDQSGRIVISSDGKSIFIRDN